MVQKNAIKLFEEKQVRTIWDDEKEQWYFSVIDVVAILTDSPNPRKYWSVLKTRLKKEGSELTTNCSQLKMRSAIYQTWAGKTAREYKRYKGLTKENLRDNMTNKELVLNMLAELSTKEISESNNPNTFDDHIEIAQQGGSIARHARMELEEKTGQPVITSINAQSNLQLQKDIENK